MQQQGIGTKKCFFFFLSESAASSSDLNDPR